MITALTAPAWRSRRQYFTICGSASRSEFALPLGLVLFKRESRQDWSPAMSEVRTEYGVRLGALHISAGGSRRIIRDKNVVIDIMPEPSPN